MIRKATPQDFEAIARLQIESWRSAYKSMLPPYYLGQPVHDDLMDRWRDHSPAANDVILVHQGPEGINGFVNVLGQTPAYVDNLHVRPTDKSAGIGTKLMRSAAARLVELGQTTVWLTVITTNAEAIRFYQRLGATRGPEKQEILYGQPVTAYPMTWSDLPALAGLG